MPSSTWRRLDGVLALARLLRGGETRVLVAIEEEYRAYQGVIAAGIEVLRPGVKVVVGRGAAASEIDLYDFQVIVSTEPDAFGGGRGDGPAWVQLSLDPTRPTEVRIGERHLKLSSFALESLLEVIDEVERLARTDQNPANH